MLGLANELVFVHLDKKKDLEFQNVYKGTAFPVKEKNIIFKIRFNWLVLRCLELTKKKIV